MDQQKMRFFSLFLWHSERTLRSTEFPLQLKQKFWRISEEPTFVITKEEEAKVLLPSSSVTSLPKIVVPEEVKPLEKKSKRPRSQTFALSGFSLKSSNTDTQLPRESESPPTSPAEPTPLAGVKGTILVCPDLEKLAVEKISIMSTTTSQVLIQNSEFLLDLIP